MKGTIAKIVPAKNCGFIYVAGRPEFFFHAGAVKEISFSELEEQDWVTFEEEYGDKGPRANNVKLLAKAGDLLPAERTEHGEESEEGHGEERFNRTQAAGAAAPRHRGRRDRGAGERGD